MESLVPTNGAARKARMTAEQAEWWMSKTRYGRITIKSDEMEAKTCVVFIINPQK